MSQRRFAVMGDNTFKILNKLVNNQKICRLLKYQVRDPFSDNYEDVDGVDLLNRQILAVPKVFDASTEKMSYIVAVFDNFVVNQFNPEFKISTVRFDVACPYDEWVLDENSLRPYLIMQEIDNMFNQAKLSGIGNLQFHRADMLTLSPQIGGFSMEYKINEFN
jgi:hypothetical protein